MIFIGDELETTWLGTGRSTDWDDVNPERELRIYKAAAIAGTFIDGILYPFIDQ